MSTYNDASLIYYPSGYKASKAYSLKPTDGSGDLTFTRASTATRVNESGLIEEVAANVPRLDNSQGGCSSLLLEPQRTNLVFPSATGSTQTRTTTAQSYTLSFYGTGTVVRSGTSVGTLVGTGANDRVFVTFTATAGSLTLTVTGSVTNWQLEAGAYSTSVIITTSTAVTRVVDVSNTTGLSSIIGQTEGTIFLDFTYYADNRTIYYFDLTESASFRVNNILIFKGTSNSLLVRLYANSAIILTFNLGVLSNGSNNKIAIAYSSGNSSCYMNGVQVGTSSNTFTFTNQINDINITETNESKYLMLFKTRLSDTDLATLTTI